MYVMSVCLYVCMYVCKYIIYVYLVVNMCLYAHHTGSSLAKTGRAMLV